MIVPWLQRADWSHWRRSVCRPLVPRTLAAPWFACALDRDDTVEMLPRDRLHERPELESRAIEFLRERPASWKTIATTTGFLGFGKRPRIVVHDGDPFAASRILDERFLVEAQRLIGSDHLLVAIPARNTIIAATMDSMEQLFGLASKVYADEDRGLTDRVFLANDGRLHGIGEQGVDRPRPYSLQRASKNAREVRINLVGGSDSADLLRAVILDRHLGERGDPTITSLDGANLEVSDPFWLEDGLQRARDTFMAAWDDRVVAGFATSGWSWITIPDHEPDLAKLTEFLATLPFEIATVGSEHCETALSIGPHKVVAGLAIAFRGTQHVASQRFLEHGGPWRVFRSGDVTLLQLHALDADEYSAVVQQRFALARLRDGLLPARAEFSADIEGYARGDGAFEVVIGDASRLAQARLRDLCIARRVGTLGATSFARIRFMFPLGNVGHHLHELWLRGFEVWSIGDDGQPRRLDEDYKPPGRDLVAPFPFSTKNRDVLTIYPAYDDREDPRPGVPSLVLPAIPPALREALSSDVAPYYTCTREENLTETASSTNMSAIREFIRASFAPYFHYQLEPADIAGDGTARLRGLIGEERGWPDG